jgi:hypothetical protein
VRRRVRTLIERRYRRVSTLIERRYRRVSTLIEAPLQEGFDAHRANRWIPARSAAMLVTEAYERQ